VDLFENKAPQNLMIDHLSHYDILKWPAKAGNFSLNTSFIHTHHTYQLSIIILHALNPGDFPEQHDQTRDFQRMIPLINGCPNY
jgi:hypothetical protein